MNSTRRGFIGLLAALPFVRHLAVPQAAAAASVVAASAANVPVVALAAAEAGQYTPFTFEMGMKITRELYDDDRYSIFGKMAADMAKASTDAMDREIMAVFDDAQPKKKRRRSRSRRVA